MDKEKFVLEKMHSFQETVKRKDVLEAMLTDLLKEKFPNIKRVRFDDVSFDIETQKHTIRESYWAIDKNPIPKFICKKNPKMPDTVEEFQEMKKFIEDDYKQCYTAYFWLRFRYKVK